jgi:uncharacterized membrane protein YidH (DUF202 family)
MAPGVQSQPGVFDRITRVAMTCVGLLILLVGVVLLSVAAVPVMAGAWLMRRGEGK